MALNIEGSLNLILTRLNEMVPLTENTEGLLLAGKTIDLMALHSTLSSENNIKTLGEFDDKIRIINENLKQSVEIVFDQIDKIIPTIKNSEESLLVAKAAMAVNTGIGNWIAANRPDDKDEIIEQLKKRNEITIKLMTLKLNNVISKIDNGENVMLAGKALETLLELSLNIDSSSSIVIVVAMLEKEIEKLYIELANIEIKLDNKIELVRIELTGKIDIIDDKLTSLTTLVSTLSNSITNLISDFNMHLKNVANPHTTNKSQVGLGNVDNYHSTSDLNDNSLSKFSLAKAPYDINRKVLDNVISITDISKRIDSLENGLKDYYLKTGGTISGNVNITSNMSVTGAIVANGNISGLSDIRLKNNIDRLRNCLQGLSGIRGYRYNLKGSDKTLIGLLAQEVEEIFPELVVEGKYKSIVYGNFIAVIIEAINELSHKIIAIETTLLKNKLSRGK